MIWFAPWAAIACVERTGYIRWLLAAVMLTSGLMLVATNAVPDVSLAWVKTLVLLRNVLLAVVPAVYLLERGEAPEARVA
jgi:hypothetical protein